MITPQNQNNTALLFGGMQIYDHFNYRDDANIYELSSIDGKLEWKTSGHELKYPRVETVGMLVPDDYVVCN